MAEADALRAFLRQHRALLANTSARTQAMWAQLPGHDQADVAEFLAEVVPLVEGSQVQMARLVDAMVAELATARPVGIPADAVTDLRGGTTPTDVYLRPFLRAWKDMGDGVPRADALARAQARVGATAWTDVQLSMRRAMQYVGERQRKVVGYRRTLSGGSCVFCASASTRRYHVGDLHPLHTRCDCGVSPIIGRRDPGEVWNRDLLAQLKERGPEYWKQRGYVDAKGNPVDPTKVPARLGAQGHSHELGPVLKHA